VDTLLVLAVAEHVRVAAPRRRHVESPSVAKLHRLGVHWHVWGRLLPIDI